MFNIGRIISYGLLGLVLGFVGQKLQLSPAINSALLIIISILMTLLALQMLGVESLSWFRLSLPKSLTRKIAGGSSQPNKIMPFVFGFLTFLLPCGFTLMVEGLAILSGNPVRSAIMMIAFALGTALPLMIIGLSSAKFLQGNEARADRFLKIAGVLVLFFVFYNLNVQFRLIDWDKWNGGVVSKTENIENSQVQVLKTTYTLSSDIQPNTFTVKKGQPVSFQVDVQDNGQGCMSTIMIRGLYNQPIYLEKGKTVIMDFTPTEAGDYQITCAMGVPRGTIKVIE